jgi:hypothetical protein
LSRGLRGVRDVPNSQEVSFYAYGGSRARGSHSSLFLSFEKLVDELPVMCFDEQGGYTIGRREKNIP